MQRRVVLWLCVLGFSSIANANAITKVLHDTNVIVDTNLVRGAPASVHVTVRGATTLTNSHPLGGALVKVSLLAADGTVTKLVSVRTNKAGIAVPSFVVPKVEPGSYRLVIRSRSPHGRSRVVHRVHVKDRTIVHLRTDRAVYKAGQTVRWRVTALNGTNAHPVRDQEVSVVIKDARGTSIWRGTKKTTATGMVAGEVPLGDDLVLGSYKIEASVAGKTSHGKFDVREFRLPPFLVTIEPITVLPARPRRTFRARIVARYPHGEPVAGNVNVTFGGRSESGKLDAFGRFDLITKSSFAGRSFKIRAVVSDGAGRSQSAALVVPMTTDELTVAVVPENANFVPGQKTSVTVLTTDGLGNFVPATVYLKGGGAFRRVRRQSPGVVRVDIVPETRNYRLLLEAIAASKDGRTGTGHTRLSRATSAGHRLRAERAVVEAGGKIAVTGTWKSAQGDVVATLMRNGVPLTSTRVRLGNDERFRAELVAPPGVFGLATVRVTEAGWNKKNGRQRQRNEQLAVYLVPARLRVEISGATRFRPGKRARLNVAVFDDQGRPGRNVGIAASVIDERVLQLGETKEDLVEVLRSLTVRNASAARQAGLAFATLLDKRGKAASLARRAIIESMPPEVFVPTVKVTAAERFVGEIGRVNRADRALRGVLLTQDTAFGVRDADGKWDFRDSLDNVLSRAGWSSRTRQTPWGRATDWRYAQQLVSALKFGNIADDIVKRRLRLLAGRLKKLKSRRLLHRNGTAGLAKLLQRRRVAGYLLVDPWGHEVRIQRHTERKRRGKRRAFLNIESAGPDGRFGSKDDAVWSDVFSEKFGARDLHTIGHGSYGVSGTGFGGGGGFGMASYGGAGSVTRTPSPMDVATRKNFDETVLWVAGLQTDDTGRATLDVPLADSITGWKVAVEALSATGALGVATMHIETFLRFYVDATPPRTLTIGDRYVLRAVVANHSKKSATFVVRASATGAVVLDDGASEKSIELPAGATGALGFPLVAKRSGNATFQFELVDSNSRIIDRVRKKLSAQAPGKLVRKIKTDDIEDGKLTIAFTVPPKTVGFSGRLRVFRGPIDQAADGLEGMLKEPYGCFEQTSSTTYPNLLVLGLLKNKKQNEALQARARVLVAKGYQRLISYEVTGGGFSWFGQAPANQVLTAYGLMEFVDMERVYPVDPALIKRTRAWLLKKQAHDGSWRPDKSWLHDWNAVQGKVSTTAYIAWAMAESGYRGRGLTRALAYLQRKRATVDKSPYLLALVAATRATAGRNPLPTLRRLARHAHTTGDGSLRYAAGGETLFYASGQGADVQVTALAATALTKTGATHKTRRALDWLWSARSPRQGWGTTQGTVLALRAAVANARPAPAKTGHLMVRLDGEKIGGIDLGSDTVPSVVLPKNLVVGEHVLTIEGDANGVLKSDLRTSWRQTAAPVAEEHGMRVSLAVVKSSMPPAKTKPVDPSRVGVGGSVPLLLTLENPGDKIIPMPTVSVPVPPGFHVDRATLDRLVRRSAISKYEDMGAVVHLYMSKLGPSETKHLRYGLVAEAECNVMQRPAQAIAYYDPTTGGASEALRLSVQTTRRSKSDASTAVQRPDRGVYVRQDSR